MGGADRCPPFGGQSALAQASVAANCGNLTTPSGVAGRPCWAGGARRRNPCGPRVDQTQLPVLKTFPSPQGSVAEPDFSFGAFPLRLLRISALVV